MEEKHNKSISKIEPWILAARPRTLPAAVAPVIVGSALALAADSFSLFISLACMLLAGLLQIGSNFANDLFDYKKGTDTPERVGPKRAVASGLISVKQMAVGTFLVLLGAVIIGLYLTLIGGPWLLVIGVFCVIAAVMYTAGPFALAYNGLGDIAVFIFFGLVAVMGTYYLQAQEITLVSLIAAVGVGVLSTNILVVNNTRDRHTDEKTGKKTLAVRFGHDFCIKQYTVLLIIAYICVLILMTYSKWALLAFATIPSAISRRNELISLKGTSLNVTLGKTAQLLFWYSLLLSIGLVL